MIYKCSGNTDSGSGTEAVKRIVNFYLRPNQRQQKGGQQKQQRQEMQGQEMQGQKRPWEQEDLRLSLENKKAKKNADKEGGEKARDRGTSGQGAGNQRGGEKARDRGTSGQGAGNQRSGNVFTNCTFHNVNINNS